MNKQAKRTKKARSKVTDFPSSSKNKDLMKLLVSDKEFQQLVLEARDYLNIPPTGLPEELAEQWTTEMCERADTMIESEKFKNQLRKIRDDLNANALTYKEAQEQSHLLHHGITWNYLKDTGEFLADKFNVPRHFDEYIRQYIVRGTVDAPPTNWKGGFYPAGVSPHKVRYVPIEFYSQPTDEDLQHLKQHLAFFGKKLPKVTKIRTLDRDLDIEYWHENNDRFDVVTQTHYKMNAAEIAENLFNNKKMGQKVHDTIQKLKRARKQKFHSVK